MAGLWEVSTGQLADPIIGGNSFRQSSKTFLFATYCCTQRIRVFTTICCINLRFTYLLTFMGELTYLGVPEIWPLNVCMDVCVCDMSVISATLHRVSQGSVATYCR